MSPQSDDEARPPGTVEPTPVERDPQDRWQPLAFEESDTPEPAQPPEIKPTAPVEPKPPPAQKPGEPYKPTGRFMLGAGFSSVEGFIASASIVQDDLFRTGNHLSLHARLSAKRQLFLLRFADPDVLGTKLALSTDIYNDSKLRPGFRRNAAGGSLTLSHPIRDRLRAFVGYRVEEVEIERDPIVVLRGVEPVPQPSAGILSALRAGLVYSSLDNPSAPLTGSSFGVSIEVADRRLGSDLQFTKLDAWAQHHQPLGPLTLHLSGRATSIVGRGGFGVPGSERLFLDSAHELRGFRPETFTAFDPLGRPVGGELKLLGTAELELPLIRRIGLSAVGFADFGGLYDRSGRNAVGRSVGFGLLWRSPIGPLRFDWAFPLDGPSSAMNGGSPVFVFGFGSPF